MRTTDLTWDEAKNMLKLGLCSRITYDKKHLRHNTIASWGVDGDFIIKFLTGNRSVLHSEPYFKEKKFEVIK